MPMPPPGVYAPLLTLYDDGEEIDVDATAALGLRLVEAGVHGLVLSGSTGEFHLHTPVERQTLLEAVIAACPSGTPVLAQVGAPSQRDAMALAGHAVASGAAGIMLITPYYNRVGPAELAAFARAVHGAAGGLSLIAYTMPAMAGSQWPLDVLRELAAEGVVGRRQGIRRRGRPLPADPERLPAAVRGLLRNAAAAHPGDSRGRPRRHPRDRERRARALCGRVRGGSSRRGTTRGRAVRPADPADHGSSCRGSGTDRPACRRCRALRDQHLHETPARARGR